MRGVVSCSFYAAPFNTKRHLLANIRANFQSLVALSNRETRVTMATLDCYFYPVTVTDVIASDSLSLIRSTRIKAPPGKDSILHSFERKVKCKNLCNSDVRGISGLVV